MKPKFILSKSKVLEQYNKVKEIADVVSYSSKTNQIVTRILEEKTNCYFSIHLKNELRYIKDKSRVIFLAQGWNKNEIRELINLGVINFVVDNQIDLSTLMNFLEGNDYSVNLQLRIKLKENSIRTERYFVFGMSSDFINNKIKELKEHPRINQLGIHFHRKTQNMSEWNLVYEFQEMIKKENLQYLDLVNVGGGLPSEYANTNADVIYSIFNKVKEFKGWLNERDIKLMIEPGRFIAGPSAKLITKIVGIHENNIIVNASVYNTDLDALIVPVKLLVEGELTKNDPGAKPYVVKGITPCSMDLFRYRVYLKEPKVDAELGFLNAGAYNFHSDFCDLDKIETEVVE